MKKTYLLIPLLFITLMSCSTMKEIKVNQSQIAIIPKPVSVVAHEGQFILDKNTSLEFNASDKELLNISEYFNLILMKSAGFQLPINGNGGNKIVLKLVSEKLGKEGYELNVTDDEVVIKGNDYPGIFYGVETLLQLLPPEIYSKTKVSGIRWTIPAATIKDAPKYQWRGMHLDVSRHFFKTDVVKRYIDYLAYHKLNVFHWHLTDDQGWRIEIKKYPKLTEIGGFRVDRSGINWNERELPKQGEKTPYGGFYTQDEIKDVIDYAAKRYITIVPEIEMPGHALAALAAYPELSCTGGPFMVAGGQYWPITHIFCAGNDDTFTLLENVLDEVIALFPGKYIHIGGDEAAKDEWQKCPKCQARIKAEGLKDEVELQSYFTKRIEKFIASKGKTLIGWDEIIEGGLPERAAVMSWRGMEGGAHAMKEGHDVVMSPYQFVYFDYLQGDKENEPEGPRAVLPLEKVYSFELMPEGIDKDLQKHLLGGQANLWTEFIPTEERIEYMLFPRIAALSESVWTESSQKDYNDFMKRMDIQRKRYDALKVDYAKTAWGYK